MQVGYLSVFVAGMAWAVVNIMQRRQWKMNAVSLCLSGVLVLGSIIYSFWCFPFCF